MSAANGNSKIDVPPAFGATEAAHRNPVTVLWRRRWIIVTCLILSVVGAVIYLKVATPIYQSNAKIYIRQDAARVISVDPTLGLNATQNFLQTQCALIQSQAILEMVLAEPGIRDLKSFPPGADVLGMLRRMVTATVGRRDDLITISARSTEPGDAPKIANAVVVAFTKYQEAQSRSTTRELLDLLSAKKREVDTDLEAKHALMLDFKLKNAKFSFGGDGITPQIQRMNELTSTLTRIELERIAAVSEYEEAKQVMSDPVRVRQFMETRQFKSETAQLRAEWRAAQQKLAGYSVSYLPDNPNLGGILATLEKLKEEMAAEDRATLEAHVFGLERQVLAARRKEDELKRLQNEQSLEVREYNTVAAQFEKLNDELERAKRDFNSLDEKIRQFSRAENATGLNVSPVESAVISRLPIEPDTSTSLSYALILGAILGSGLAFLRDWMDQRLQSAEEIKQALGVPVLGAVPHISGSVTPSQRGLYIHNEPMSDVAEAYRTVRTAVYFGNDGVVPKTILITSPAPGDGKTTLASNLAIAMAQAGNRILLLDADFRKPTQHKIFEIDKKIGLSNVLAGASTLAEAIHHSRVPGLDILPCGPIPANPSEILNSQTFADMLEELAGQYDHVLLDSPPVMPVTDARILAASCDATVLALRSHRTTLKGAVYTRDILHAVGSQVLGVVVNDIPRRRGLYGYYYGYGEPYQYGYGHQRNRAGSNGASGSNGANGASENGNGHGSTASKAKQQA